MDLDEWGGLQVAFQATNNDSGGSSAELGAQTAFIFYLLQTRVSLGSWSYIWRVQIGRPSFEALLARKAPSFPIMRRDVIFEMLGTAGRVDVGMETRESLAQSGLLVWER